ncbi:MAG: 1-(5-phosphoribosyl)-5-[(5-phosphoribosylamino)methylideneamino]imidazole-4-carboxamide isomerase [bacterium]
MLVIPAIDIRAGNCVRLTQGKIENEIVYSHDPLFIAKLWQSQGAKRIHVVDLDGAFTGSPQNLDILEKIRTKLSIKIEFGGGIRDFDVLDAVFGMGVDYCVLGTVAINNPDFLKEAIAKYPKKIIVAIDALKEKVAISGWKDVTDITVLELARQLKGMGLEEILYTDVEKDGMLKGPNIESVQKFADELQLNIIISGGVSTYEDLEKIRLIKSDKITGVIIGRALYTNDIKIDRAIEIIESNNVKR